MGEGAGRGQAYFLPDPQNACAPFPSFPPFLFLFSSLRDIVVTGLRGDQLAIDV